MTSLKIIAIDGPVASGKTSVSREVARILGWSWVSTGAFYRAIAFIIKQANIASTQELQILDVIGRVKWKIVMGVERTSIYIEDREVTDDVYSEKLAEIASQLSSFPKVREALLSPQRDCLKQANGGLIAEGRDCGTIIFPEADLKIYLTASSLVRGKRMVIDRGVTSQQASIYQKERDVRDSQRHVAPLKVADGAEWIDTSKKPLDVIVQEVVRRIQRLT